MALLSPCALWVVAECLCPLCQLGAHGLLRGLSGSSSAPALGHGHFRAGRSAGGYQTSGFGLARQVGAGQAEPGLDLSLAPFTETRL